MSQQETLSELRDKFARSPLLAMPIAGTIMWALIGVCGAILPVEQSVWALFVGTGMIFWLAVLIGRFTGEDFLRGQEMNTELDRLFLLTILMANLVWAIAIPFFLIEPTSLPLTVGILAGLMWVPLSWLIRHWVGVFHALSRTVLVLVAWYAFPDHRFVVIPAVIVLIYLVSIFVLVRRRRPA
jgi:hypothetical protein